MRISDLFSKEAILLDASCKDRNEILDTLVELQAKHGNILDKDDYRSLIEARENECSTYVGEEIAIPHARGNCVTKPSLAVLRLKTAVQYNEGDAGKSSLFFMIAAPEDGNVYMELLSGLMGMLMHEEFTEKLRKADSAEQFLAAIDEKESEDHPEQVEEVYRVLCVTACPTGIAHTYMAAEALRKAGGILGITLKVETNGSTGAKNVLMENEIAHCEGIIVAADKAVEMKRFEGKPVLITNVAAGLHRPEELLAKVVAGKVPVYHAEEEQKKQQAEKEKNTPLHIFYKHLMNGVSRILPFAVAGGVLLSTSYLLDDLWLNPLNFGMNTPLAAFFHTAGSSVFNFILPVMAAFIAESIADRPGFAAGFAGGFLALSGTTFATLSVGSAQGLSGGFVAAMLAGFAGGTIVKYLEKWTKKIPFAMDGIRPMLIYPVVGVFLTCLLVCLCNPVLSGLDSAIFQILESLDGIPKGMFGALIAALMAIDMGGPVGKAAYVFGVASLTAGSFEIMAAVMVGGMVPPLAIALSTTLFPEYWNEEERKKGKLNYLMGMCFVTEGAIPYVAKDPGRVIPSCLVGSAIAGYLSMIWQCSVRSPHGGIFVLPTVSHPFMYLVALVLGSVTGALILGILKKRKRV